MKKIKVPSDGKLHKKFVPLIRGVRESKPRRLHLDEYDDDGELRDDDFEKLFEDPEKTW